MLTGGVETSQTSETSSKIGGAINNAVKSILYMEAIRNLNWSRDYCWYVELDGVPNPFQRGGVIGLPVVDVTFETASGTSYTWEAGNYQFSVPKGNNILSIQLSMLDDEQGTILTFFERWYNLIYNSGNGILPVTEACKCITIAQTKATRSNVTRVIKSSDNSQIKSVVGRDFLVYPENELQIQEKNGTGQPRMYTVRLIVVKQCTPDHGNPSRIEGQASIMGIEIGGNTTGGQFLDRIADYI
jgi:hypothetical protein